MFGLMALTLLGLAQTSAGQWVNVVSYNAYWHMVRRNNWWSRLHSRLRANKADLYGFQECENVASLLSGSGLASYHHFQGPNKPAANPAPLAWNPSVFSKIGGPHSVWVERDKYGNRYMNWVRLHHRASGRKVFFANTHGKFPTDCGSAQGRRWASGITSNKQTGDVVIFTGDFNCGIGSAAMNEVTRIVNRGVKHGIDHILTSASNYNGGAKEGNPSDHPLIQANIQLGGGGPSPSPNPAARRRRGPSPSPSGGCGAVWNTVVKKPSERQGYSCGSRINWMKSHERMSDTAAKNFVAGEFPTGCGACKVGGSPRRRSSNPSCSGVDRHKTGCRGWANSGFCSNAAYRGSMQYWCECTCRGRSSLVATSSLDQVKPSNATVSSMSAEDQGNVDQADTEGGLNQRTLHRAREEKAAHVLDASVSIEADGITTEIQGMPPSPMMRRGPKQTTVNAEATETEQKPDQRMMRRVAKRIEVDGTATEIDQQPNQPILRTTKARTMRRVTKPIEADGVTTD